MPETDRTHAVVRGWVQKAENDLVTAAHTLKLAADAPADTVCFHAQQCVEKYLKALLVLNGRDFPKTHDIGVLLHLLPRSFDPGLSIEEQRRLSVYATVTRYPGDDEPLTLTRARQSVAIARRVRRVVRRLLPRSAVRRPRT